MSSNNASVVDSRLASKDPMSRTIFPFGLLIFIAGCGAPTPAVMDDVVAHGSAEFGGGAPAGQPGIDYGSVRYIGRRVVVWTDGSEEIPEIGGGKVRGHVQSRRLKSLECRYEIPWSGTGTATIDGQTFRMTEGNLFLVSLDGPGVRVRQLRRDLPIDERELNGADIGQLKQAVQDDPEFREFFKGGARLEPIARPVGNLH